MYFEVQAVVAVGNRRTPSVVVMVSLSRMGGVVYTCLFFGLCLGVCASVSPLLSEREREGGGEAKRKIGWGARMFPAA